MKKTLVLPVVFFVCFISRTNAQTEDSVNADTVYTAYINMFLSGTQPIKIRRALVWGAEGGLLVQSILLRSQHTSGDGYPASIPAAVNFAPKVGYITEKSYHTLSYGVFDRFIRATNAIRVRRYRPRIEDFTAVTLAQSVSVPKLWYVGLMQECSVRFNHGIVSGYMEIGVRSDENKLFFEIGFRHYGFWKKYL